MTAEAAEHRTDGDSQPAGKDSPHLERHEQKQAADAQPMQARVIHEILREEGEHELSRPVGALLWSGLAAGLSMGFSFLTMALLKKSMGDNPAADVIAPLGYPIGFLIAVLGKQQLFTETTLTATLPLFHQPTRSGFAKLARMWTVVLIANLVGTVAFAWLVSIPGFTNADLAKALVATARGAFGEGFVVAAVRAMFSGWLIALLVWLLPASKSAAPFVIAALTYVVALAGFPHVIAGSTEAAYVTINGGASWPDYFVRFLAPTLVGNLIGGTALAALLNHAPVAHDMAARQDGRG